MQSPKTHSQITHQARNGGTMWPSVAPAEICAADRPPGAQLLPEALSAGSKLLPSRGLCSSTHIMVQKHLPQLRCLILLQLLS